MDEIKISRMTYDSKNKCLRKICDKTTLVKTN